MGRYPTVSEAQDDIITSIQNYARSLDAFPETQITILAIAEDLGEFMTKDLAFVKEYAGATYVTGPRGNEELDIVEYHSEDRQFVLDHLNRDQALDAEEADQAYLEGIVHRRVVSQLYTEWDEDIVPELDPELVALAQNEQ